jgi:hypothetical protein
VRGCVVATVHLDACRLDHVDRGRHHPEDSVVSRQKISESFVVGLDCESA